MDIRKRKHAAVTVIAIFQLIFGILGLFCGIVALSGVAQGRSPPSNKVRPVSRHKLKFSR